MRPERDGSERINTRHTVAGESKDEIDVVNHQVMHNPDVRRAECVRAKSLTANVHRLLDSLLKQFERRIETFDMANLQQRFAGGG